MRLEAISAYAPDQVWSNARVAARLRLERMRLSARTGTGGYGPLDPQETKLFQTSDRWVRRFIGFSERRFIGAVPAVDERAHPREAPLRIHMLAGFLQEIGSSI